MEKEPMERLAQDIKDVFIALTTEKSVPNKMIEDRATALEEQLSDMQAAMSCGNASTSYVIKAKV